MIKNTSLEAFEAHQDVLNKRQVCFDAGIEMPPAVIKKLRILSNIQLTSEERLQTAHDVIELLEKI